MTFEEYLVTALVPSETACYALSASQIDGQWYTTTLDSSPGKMSRTAVWISREEIVDFLLYAANLL